MQVALTLTKYNKSNTNKNNKNKQSKVNYLIKWIAWPLSHPFTHQWVAVVMSGGTNPTGGKFRAHALKDTTPI